MIFDGYIYNNIPKIRKFSWEFFGVFLMFASFNFRCSALPMKIKPR